VRVGDRVSTFWQELRGLLFSKQQKYCASHLAGISSAAAMADRRATSSELYAMSKHLAVKCSQPEVAYLNCKDKHSHPEDCLQEAKAVIKCSENL
jgi:hypothetical protein